MFKQLSTLAFVLISSHAYAEDLITLDCVGSNKSTLRYVFDTKSQQVQFSAPNENSLIAPSYGKISPAVVTETSLIIKSQSITREPQNPITISRLTGNSESKNAKGEPFTMTCKPSSAPASFIPPVITPDKDGAISVACKMVNSFMVKDHAGEPIDASEAGIVVFPQSKEGLLYGKSTPDTKPLTVGSTGPDSIQLCFGACSGGAIILNLMNGGGFFLNPWNGTFAFTSDKQFLCKNGPRPEAAQRKF